MQINACREEGYRINWIIPEISYNAVSLQKERRQSELVMKSGGAGTPHLEDIRRNIYEVKEESGNHIKDRRSGK